jgi:hypothetical protein
VLRLLVTASVVLSWSILITLLMEALRTSETSVLTRPHVVTSQQSSLFIVTAVRTSTLKTTYTFSFREGPANVNFTVVHIKQNEADFYILLGGGKG